MAYAFVCTLLCPLTSLREAKQAVAHGAAELDLVINYPLLQRQSYSAVAQSIRAIRAAAPPPVVLKCILETSQLGLREIVAGCLLAADAGTDFVKTSTGFNGPGASVENVAIMKAVVLRSGVKVKASGGVRSLKDCLKMIEAGADRIGTSSGVIIMQEAAATATSSGDRLSAGAIHQTQSKDAGESY